MWVQQVSIVEKMSVQVMACCLIVYICHVWYCECNYANNEFRFYVWFQQFSNEIEIWLEFCFALTLILIKWSLQNLPHDLTVVLLWHVQWFVMNQWSVPELHWGEFSIKFNFEKKNIWLVTAYETFVLFLAHTLGELHLRWSVWHSPSFLGKIYTQPLMNTVCCKQHQLGVCTIVNTLDYIAALS